MMAQNSIVHPQAQDVWALCLPLLQQELGEVAYNTFITPIVPKEFSDNKRLTLVTPTMYFAEYIHEHYADSLKRVFSQVIGPGFVVDFDATIDRDAPQAAKGSLHTDYNVSNSTAPTAPPQEETFKSRLSPYFTFENFYQGESNSYALAIAQAVAQEPGGQCPVLYLYGPSGCGKTHLCHAVGNEILRTKPNLRVLYVHTDTFVRQYISGAQQKTLNDFHKYYQQIDVLILDDIHSLVGKVTTQEAFFQIFNHLKDLGKQIVLTCDRKPADLKGLPDRLSSRIKESISAAISRPDPDLRRTYVREKSAKLELDLKPEFIDLIADKITTDIRALKGVLENVSKSQTFLNKRGRAISERELREIISHVVSEEKREVSIDEIIDSVCAKLNVSREAICGASRKLAVATARSMVMYLARKLTNTSLAAIGATLGGRAHATIIHGVKDAESRKSIDADYAAALDSIERSLR